jgi:hypothetical protein
MESHGSSNVNFSNNTMNITGLESKSLIDIVPHNMSNNLNHFWSAVRDVVIQLQQLVHDSIVHLEDSFAAQGNALATDQQYLVSPS